MSGAELATGRSLDRVSHISSLRRQSPVQYPAHQETTLLATHLTPPIIITMVMVALVLPHGEMKQLSFCAECNIFDQTRFSSGE